MTAPKISLPHLLEIVPQIIEQLEPCDVRSLEQVSHAFRDLCDDATWRRAAARQLALPPAALVATPALRVGKRSVAGTQLMRAVAIGLANEVRRSVHARPQTREEKFLKSVAYEFTRAHNERLSGVIFHPRLSTEEPLEWPHVQRDRRANRVSFAIMAGSLVSLAVGIVMLSDGPRMFGSLNCIALAAFTVGIAVSDERRERRLIRIDNARRDQTVADARREPMAHS